MNPVVLDLKKPQVSPLSKYKVYKGVMKDAETQSTDKSHTQVVVDATGLMKKKSQMKRSADRFSNLISKHTISGTSNVQASQNESGILRRRTSTLRATSKKAFKKFHQRSSPRNIKKQVSEMEKSIKKAQLASKWANKNAM